MIAAVIQFFTVAVLLGIASVKDIKTREIPDWISFCVLCAAVLDFNIQNLWGIIVATIFFVVALQTGKIGGGDVKLIAALSVVCGLWSSLALLLFAQLFMLVFYWISVIVQRSRGRTADKSLRFVPFITFGFVLTSILL